MAGKTIHILGGGTVSHVRNHLALAAPAYGGTARRLFDICGDQSFMERRLHLTMMAGGYGYPGDNRQIKLETNEDVAALLKVIAADPDTKIIFMTCALVDFYGAVGMVKSGKHAERLHSRTHNRGQFVGEGNDMMLFPKPKLLPEIRKDRKDIYLVAFKTTTEATEDEQYAAALHLLKESSCNLVLANDVVTRTNMIVTPEEARYHVTKNREEALWNLAQIAILRSQLTFTRSTVIDGEPISWYSDLVPNSLRAVVNHCISRGAYKPFNGATVGHFACKINDTTFLTSIRKSDFNHLPDTGLVMVKTDGPDSVIAYGAKPSVGGQSQRIVFHDHPEYDCIVHFHCPKKAGSEVPTVSQREFECGSHQCGQNTSSGLTKFGNLSAVYLDEHGPNIVFNHEINPQEVIAFIDNNFDLSGKTGGLILSLNDYLPHTEEQCSNITATTSVNVSSAG
jgi:hypothetical protein